MERLFTNKYKPKIFKDYEQHEKQFKLIEMLMNTNKFDIILNGRRGTGKTTIINSIISQYYHNISPVNYTSNVLFINNIKEHGISYYRNEVKTFCQIPCSIHNKKKTIIIDDIDLTTDQTQQVIRCLIDKYSHNLNFLTSTSNIQKVIEPLQTRFFIINLQPISEKSIVSILNRITARENIMMDDDSKRFVIETSNNNIKTLIQTLQKIKLLNIPINLSTIVDISCSINYQYFEDYIQCIKEGNLQGAINIIIQIYDKGYSIIDILDDFFIFTKGSQHIHENEKYCITQCICKYINYFYNHIDDPIILSFLTNMIFTKLDIIESNLKEEQHIRIET